MLSPSRTRIFFHNEPFTCVVPWNICTAAFHSGKLFNECRSKFYRTNVPPSVLRSVTSRMVMFGNTLHDVLTGGGLFVLSVDIFFGRDVVDLVKNAQDPQRWLDTERLAIATIASRSAMLWCSNEGISASADIVPLLAMCQTDWNVVVEICLIMLQLVIKSVFHSQHARMHKWNGMQCQQNEFFCLLTKTTQICAANISPAFATEHIRKLSQSRY